jgi:predicted nucleotide-binding protein
MDRTKKYYGVKFSPEVIKEARDVMKGFLGKPLSLRSKHMRLELPKDEEWTYDNEEEFFAAYRDPFNIAHFAETYSAVSLAVDAYHLGWGHPVTSVKVEMEKREQIMGVFNIFEANVEKCKLPEVVAEDIIAPKIFIGHGHNNQWRDLKDHLHDKHGFEVEAYEIGARAGLTVKEVLDEMLTASSFALLVFTGEDEDAKGKMHARENVIHELGLFQGRLGWRKAIVLLEEGVEEFSNMQGINEIRFKKNDIGQVYGEVLATIKREFK